jgi:two-component system, NarL family, sensor histidine kinase DegS
MVLTDGQSTSSREDLLKSIQAELDETGRGVKEVNLMLEQSRVEVTKLSQRNAAITAHLQQIQSKLSQMPVDEVRLAYDSALDAQQRLFVMRGQLEKLQSDQSHLERFKASLEKLRDALSVAGSETPGKNEKGGLASVEMLINAQEAERQRLSRQMHDGPAQALSNFILQTEIAMRLLDIDAGQAKNELGNLKVSAMSTFQKIRNFIFELRPMMLDDLGLIPTIRRYADTYKEQTGLEVNVTITGNERRIEPYLEVMVFRAMQELLGNSARYSQASVIKVQVDMGDAFVKLNVGDNGKGFDPELAEKTNGLGLKLIKERAELIGGKCEIDSAPGKGARITLVIPARA